MNKLLFRIGLLLISLGILLTVIAAISGTSEGKHKVEWGIGGFIGPFPFGFASSREILLLILCTSLLILILFFFLFR